MVVWRLVEYIGKRRYIRCQLEARELRGLRARRITTPAGRQLELLDEEDGDRQRQRLAFPMAQDSLREQEKAQYAATGGVQSINNCYGQTTR